MDQGVAAITPTTAAMVPSEAMRSLMRENSSLGEAVWWGRMTDFGVLRDRIID
jgi:hypothetical protein